MVFPPTTMVAIENTHNRGGGVVFRRSIVAICAAARSRGVATYLDGRAVQCGGGQRPIAGRVGASLRHRIRLALKGNGLSGWKPYSRHR